MSPSQLTGKDIDIALNYLQRCCAWEGILAQLGAGFWR